MAARLVSGFSSFKLFQEYGRVGDDFLNRTLGGKDYHKVAYLYAVLHGVFAVLDDSQRVGDGIGYLVVCGSLVKRNKSTHVNRV
jgi:hypothetical protein